ncbi:MAG: glycosyltransferase [Rhodobacteraceae bacterium]|nr:glycosyltransferase [Paracoccaceae bacterium]MBR9822850.1 glycosyltransferase [Paracoccaceae bacterium]
MKVVMITSVPAVPSDAGNRARIRALAEEILSLGHELVLVLLPMDRRDLDAPRHQAHFDQVPGRCRVIGLSNGGRLGQRGYRLRRSLRKGWRKPLRALGLEAGFYTALDLFWNPRWDAPLRDICRDAGVVMVEYAFSSKAFEAAPAGARKILDTHDILSDRHRTFRGRGLDHWVSLQPSDECRAFRRADVVLAIQEDEARAIRALLQQHGRGDGADTPEVAVVSHLPRPSTLPATPGDGMDGLFVGSDNPANRASLSVFVDHTLPRVTQALPAFRLVVAGTICRSLPDHPNIRKMGVVEDLSQVYRDASFSLNPMEVGTGINIKLLDAMAAGLPVVSTLTGVRGVPPKDCGGIRIVGDQDHAAFAGEVIALAEDAELRRSLGDESLRASRAWVRQQARELANQIEGRLSA